MIELAISSWTVHGLLGEVSFLRDANGKMVNQNEPCDRGCRIDT